MINENFIYIFLSKIYVCIIICNFQNKPTSGIDENSYISFVWPLQYGSRIDLKNKTQYLTNNGP
jgi:hypothetical protein